MAFLARPKVPSNPRLCDNRTKIRSPSSRDGGGSVRNGMYSMAPTGSWPYQDPSSFLLFLFFGRGCEYLIGWQVESLALPMAVYM